MQSPLVSVVIPAHNSAQYICETAACVLAQMDDLELIVIDDGSRDNTVEVVAGLARQDARVSLIQQHQQGLGAARNAGIAVARGKYFTTIDGDDLWAPTKLVQQVAVLEASPARTISLTGVRRFMSTPEGTKVWSVETRPPTLIAGPAKMAQLIGLSGAEMVVFNTAVFRREDIEELRGWSTEVWTAHDWELWLRAGHSFEFSSIDAPLLYYRKHAASLTRLHNLDDVLKAHEALITRELRLGVVTEAVARAAIVERRLDHVRHARYAGELLGALRRWARLGVDPYSWTHQRLVTEFVDLLRATVSGPPDEFEWTEF